MIPDFSCTFHSCDKTSRRQSGAAPCTRTQLKTLLQLSAVTKSFGAVRALKGVSFDLQAGEVHALLGENGAGKSTLIKVITGAHQPDGGTIEIGGETVAHLTPATAHALGIACIYQQPALFPDLTVAENIGLRLENTAAPFRRVHWSERRAHARANCCTASARRSPPDAEVRSLSMPEQQLVEIACALGSGARIVIMDEPTASLTQKEQHLLFAVVRDLRAQRRRRHLHFASPRGNLRARRSRHGAARWRERRHAICRSRLGMPLNEAPVG